jgi:hypothetical protein
MTESRTGEETIIKCRLSDYEAKGDLENPAVKREGTYPPTYRFSSPGTRDNAMFDVAGL